jgi:CP family cyanate transporter-like MFS transporter
MSQRVRSRPAGAATVLLAVGIVLIAVNLRPPVTTVGPLADDIRSSLGVSNTALGLLTALPILAFGAVSTAATSLALRFGMERVLGVALLVIAGGILLRSAGPVATAFIGTTVAGAGIAAGNVLLPGLVKEEFPDRSGPMTSLYVTAMVGMAGLASAVSVPLADDLGLGWQGSLACWAIPCGIAFLVWVPQLRQSHVPAGARSGAPVPWRSPLAWQIMIYMGLQSLLFFAVLAWLPDLLHSEGLSFSKGGLMVGLLQVGGLIATIGMPVLAARRPSQGRLVVFSTALAVAGLAGLLVAPAHLTVVWAMLIGAATGCYLSLALTFLVLRAPDTAHTAALSGMVQSGGYMLAAVGPTAIGALHDLAGGWTVPLWALMGVTLLTCVFGLGAARDRLVGASGRCAPPASP